MAKVTNNHGFNKCISFDEIAMLALRRALDINDTGVSKAHIRITPKQIDVYFYKNGELVYAANYTHATIVSGGCTLADLDDAFSRHEPVRKEAVHA